MSLPQTASILAVGQIHDVSDVSVEGLIDTLESI